MTLGNMRGLSWAAALRFVATAAMLCASLFTSGTASAASLQGPVSGWQQGTEPNWMSMYIYVPDNVAQNPPILVMLHYCGGNAGNVFSLASNGGIVSDADQKGYILLVPQTSRNCWDVATNDALTHGGGSDTLSIVHQVEYTIDQYSANADRVYVIGTSGGAMGAEGLAAVYPDVFKGAVEFSGVPAGCWAVGNMVDGQWSSACAGGQVTHTAQEWGDMVRDMYPGYDGFRPRIQLWHGTGDTTINFNNQTEAIKQWTNVLGLPDDPTMSSNVTVNGVNFNRDEWKDECGTTVLDVMTEPNGPHNTSANMTGQYSLSFLSLDVPGDTDPQAASECGTPSDSTSTSSTSSTSGGGMGGSGGMTATTGSPTTDGTATTDGTTTTGGVATTGGNTASTSMGGAASTGAVGTDTGTNTTGVSMSTTGTPSTTTDTGTSNVTNGATTVGTGTTGMAATATDGGGNDPAGCACRVRNTSGPVNSLALALAGLFVAMFVRRRSKR